MALSGDTDQKLMINIPSDVQLRFQCPFPLGAGLIEVKEPTVVGVGYRTSRGVNRNILEVEVLKDVYLLVQ